MYTYKKIAIIVLGAFSAVAAVLGLKRKAASRDHTWPKIHFSWVGLRKTIFGIMGDMGKHNTGVLASGIAYNAALAFFPIFAASLAIATIVITPEQVASVVQTVNDYLPKDIAGLISTQLEAQAGRYGGNVVIAIVAISISLIGASGAIEGIIRSLNAVYGVVETRNPVKMRAISLIFLLAGLVIMATVAGLLLVDEYMVGLGVPLLLVQAVDLMRWPLLFVIMIFAFTSLYRYGPNRPKARWRWASWGAVFAAVLWLIATAALFAYSRYFPAFSESYTLFAGIVVLMIWFNLSATALLIGGHINARLERHAGVHLG